MVGFGTEDVVLGTNEAVTFLRTDGMHGLAWIFCRRVSGGLI